MDSRLWHPFADMGTVRDHEFVLTRGEDVWVFDRDGERYLDATAALWYSNVGHGRREIVAAVAEQMGKLEAYSAFGDFANEPALELAQMLSDLAPMPSRAFLVAGGGDAIDTAAKLARRYWYESGEPDRNVLISRVHGYHGTHGFGTALAGIPANRVGFGPQVDTVQVPYDSLEILEAEIDRVGAERVAGVFVEPVIGAGGVYPPVPGYIEGVKALCDRTGVLMIVDAVICGFGRLGTWYGIERWDVAPDMITFAKGVTSGYLPLGGVMVSDRVAEPFFAAPGAPVFRHGPTYSAHPACCAAAIANLGLLGQDGLLERGRAMEQPLVDALAPLTEHAAVSEIRGGVGTMAAVAFTDETLERLPDAVNRVVALAREKGVLVRPLGQAVAISPPLTATEEHFGLIAEAIGHGVTSLAGAARL
jgi:adenosylmethionine-8-amino-7-oxononanoate aminotransferase